MRGKKISPIAFIAVLLISAIMPNIALSGSSPMLQVNPATNTGSVGEDFFVDIGISNVISDESLYAWEFHLRYNPAVLGTLHTRYFRSDKTLMMAQSGIEGSVTVSRLAVMLIYQLGMRVWKRDTIGTETEITSGTPVAIASQKLGNASMVESAPWTCPEASLEPTDVLVVRLYGGFSMSPAVPPATWTLVDVWMTGQGVGALDNAVWTAYYYVQVYRIGTTTYGKLYVDSAAFNSRVEVSGVVKGAFLSDAATSQGWITKSMLDIDKTNGVLRMSEYIDPKSTAPQLPPHGAVGSGTLATIKFFIVGEGVTLMHFDFSELLTVIAGNSVTISHKPQDGVFDNRPTILPPHAIITAPLYGVEAIDVTFDASASNDASDGGWVVSYEWDFNYDGSTFDVEATGVKTTHAYPLAGTYTVALRVTDNDGLTDQVTKNMPILVWMQGGWFPDLIQNQAWPEHPKWYEDTDGRQPSFHANVGNPTDEEYQVYAEFTIFSKDEAKKLGPIVTPITTLAGGQKLELSAVMDLTDSAWRAFSGCPNPDSWNWLGYYAAYKPWDPFLMRRYTVFASCYYKNGSMSQFEKGYVVKYFHFNVVPVKHDTGIAQITADPTSQVQGGTFLVTLNVTNKGELDETFDITVLYKGEFASGTISVRTVTLQPGESRIETFTWDTSGLPLGTYIIKAKVPTCTYEWPKDLVDQEVLTVVYIIP